MILAGPFADAQALAQRVWCGVWSIRCYEQAHHGFRQWPFVVSVSPAYIV